MCVCGGGGGILIVISKLVVPIVLIVVIEMPRFIIGFENLPEDVSICFQT